MKLRKNALAVLLVGLFALAGVACAEDAGTGDTGTGTTDTATDLETPTP